MQKFPELKNNQVALLRADARTGVVVDEKLNRVINDEQTVYTVLDGYYEALQIAKSIVATEESMACTIYGKNEELLFTLGGTTKSFNQDFCLELQVHLENTFANSPDDEINALWCDGIAMPFYDSQLTWLSIKDRAQIETMAWIGTDGQTPHELIIKLGDQSVDRMINDLSLIDCLPSVEKTDWINIDIEKRTIVLQLK